MPVTLLPLQAHTQPAMSPRGQTHRAGCLSFPTDQTGVSMPTRISLGIVGV